MSEKPLPVNKGRVVIQQAKVTVKNILDAIVELVTNSDDSFTNLEEDEGLKVKPNIQIFVHRKTRGHCDRIVISDNAAGMKSEELLKAIEFGSITSGFVEGKKVRGFFGRGLKEAIIALGTGLITSRKNGEISVIKIRVKSDGFNEEVYYDDSIKASEEYLEEWELNNNGTVIDIQGIVDEFRIPDYKTFKDQIESHFALRDILANKNRTVSLVFYSETQKGSTFQTKLSFKEPAAKIVFNEAIKIENHEANLVIKESSSQLTTPYHNALGLAGILIKTEGAILENTLFGHEKVSGGLYFFGELNDPAIAERLRKKEMLISPNRTGLNWTSSYLLKLKNKSEIILRQFIEKKQKEIESREATVSLSEKDKKFKNELCKLLSDLARNELSGDEAPPVDPGELDGIDIRPLIANIKSGTSRTFTIYIPKWLSDILPTSDLKIESSNINVSTDKITGDFRPHEDDQGLLISRFNVTGKKIGEEAKISVRIGEYSTHAEVLVVEELKKGGKRKKYTGRKPGGYIKDIKPITDPNPPQRVALDDELGVLKVYVAFPGIKNYFDPWEKSMVTPVGRAILGELVLEGFCRWLTTKKQQNGELLDESVEVFNREYFDLQRKFSLKIHQFVNLYYSDKQVDK